MALRIPLAPVPLLEAEFGGCAAAEEGRFADERDGDGDEVEFAPAVAMAV